MPRTDILTVCSSAVLQNIFADLFSPLAIQKVARFQFDMIAGEEALFRLLASPPPPKATSAPPVATNQAAQQTGTASGSTLPLSG